MERQITDTREIALTADQLAGIKNYSDSKVVKTAAPEVEEVEMPAQNMFDNAAGLVAQAGQVPNQAPTPVEQAAPVMTAPNEAAPNIFNVTNEPVASTPVEAAPVAEPVQNANMFDAPSAPVAPAPAEATPMVESAPVNMFDAPSAPASPAPAEVTPTVESPAIEQTSLTQDIHNNISNEDDPLILECRALGQDIINIYMRYEALVEQVNLRLTGKTLNNQNQTMQM